MNTIHSDGMASPPNATNWTTPNRTSNRPKPAPAMLATCVAVCTFCVRRQTMDRSTRPPSSGNPGRRLKAARKRLISPSHWAVTRGTVAAGSACARTRKAPPMAALVSGPTMAMANSSPAARGSWEISATPPNTKSLMRGTAMPRRTAISAWAASWARIEPKKMKLASSPPAQ